jgi:hypothetical protein
VTRGRIDDATRYARAIERRWSRLWEQPVVLSPRDWSRIARWHALGIPLAIVEDAMQDEAERTRSRARPRRLASLAPLVEEAWAVVLAGRHDATPTEATHSPMPTAERWRACADREPAGSSVAELLCGLLDRLQAGESGESLDHELDRRLTLAVEPTLREQVLEEVTRKLEPFRKRMSAERLETTRERACVYRLRRRLDLPRLASEGAEA